MKLHCPHCGVKGSAEDSYSGRTVKCPKCQGIFEVKADMAFEQSEDAALLSVTSSTITESPAPLDEVETQIAVDEDFGETGADEVLSVDGAEESVQIDGPLAEPESAPTSPAEQEEVLDWEGIASEIDLQLDESEIGEEHEETQEGSPADLSFLHDEFEKSAGDIGLPVEEDSDAGDEPVEDIWAEVEDEPAEIEETDLIEESSLFDPVDSEGPGQEIEDDLAEAVEIEESSEEGVSEDEALLVQEADEIEIEPYGIDKEECWQCGKKESFGEPFVAKDGRLYCINCAPIEDLEKTAESDQDHDTDDMASAQAPHADVTDLTDVATAVSGKTFSITDVIRKAWAKTKGAKGVIWAGSAIMYLVLLVIVAGGAFVLPSLVSDLTNVTGVVSNILFQAITNVFSVLFTAGLLFMGVRKVAGESISWKMIFKGFPCAGKIIVATILQSLLITIGFLLLILPGIYLAVGYAMTLPLIIDKGLSPWQAMEMSRKAIHKIWWKVAGLFLVMGLIFVGSLIPLGIGLIWTWPMFIIVAGVVYQYLFGDEGSIG